MIGDDGFLLAFGGEQSMCLYKFDFKNSSINSLDSIDFNDNEVDSIHVDQLNPLKFMIYIKDETFAMGKIENEKIVLGDFKDCGDIGFYGRRLMDQKLQGFAYDYELKLFKFCEWDLDTMEETKIDVPIELDNESLEIKYFWGEPYFWSKNRFYSMFEMSDNQKHMFMFNVDELKWTKIQIVVNELEGMFVDSNDVLTLLVGNYGKNATCAFYRLASRKPEKLKILAHLAILRQSTLFGEDKYSNCVKSLPIQL